MMIHEFHDITTAQAMLRDITRQCDIRIQLKLHLLLRLSGISVTNFVMPDACSVIQMLRIGSATPFGPLRIPRI
jgi:hypothetical protein